MVKFFLSILLLGSLAAITTAAEPELKFELYKDKASDYRWRLKDADGAIVAVAATGHKKHADAKSGMETFRKAGGAGDLRFDTFYDESKQYRWRLVTEKGETVAVSNGGFRVEADADRAIASLKIGVEKAGVVVLK